MKPVVHYDNEHIPTLMVGISVCVFPIDHTSPFVSNGGKPAITSKIVKLHGCGVFETENTLYMPEANPIPYLI